MKRFWTTALLSSMATTWFTGANLPAQEQPAAVQPAAPAVDQAVSREAARLEAELGKYKDSAPEAGETLFKLVELYHGNALGFGLVRAGQRFVAAHPQDPRHPAVMLKLLDGLEVLSRHREFTVIARQFLTRYPQAAECPAIEERLAYTLEKMNEKLQSAEVYRSRWQRQPDINGRPFGVKACELFSAGNGDSIRQGAELAEEMFDKLPKNDFARHIGWRSMSEWRRISQWAKSNQIGLKLIASGVLKDPNELREAHRQVAEHFGYIGQYANAAQHLKAARAIRDDQSLHYSHIERLYNSAVRAGEIEPVIMEYFNKYQERDDRWDRLGLLGHTLVRDGDKPRGLQVFRQIVENMPAMHGSASQFVAQNGTEPEKSRESEQLLLASLGKNPKGAWHLRYVLGFDVYRDRLKDDAKARQTLRDFIEKSPSDDGNSWNVLSWLLSTAPSDAEFNADLARMLKSRRDHIHMTNYRQYLRNWGNEVRRNKDLKARGDQVLAEVEKQNQDPVVKLFLELNNQAHTRQEAGVRAQLLKPEVFNTLSADQKRLLTGQEAWWRQHYANAEERPEAATYYARLVQMVPSDFENRYRWLQVATDYNTPPEVSREAALRVMEVEPPYGTSDLWRRLFVAAERSKDQNLAKQALAWTQKALQKFGPDSGAASYIGDALVRLGLENEGLAYWTQFATPGPGTMGSYEVRECSGRLYQKLTDSAARIQFAQQRLAADTDFHGRYAMWLAEEYFKAGDFASLDKVLRESHRRQQERPFRGWDFDPYTLNNMFSTVRQNMELAVEKKQQFYALLRDLKFDWPAAQGELALLELEPATARKPMERLLAWQRVTRPLWPDATRWDQVMPFAQQAMTRQDFSAAATLLTGMLSNITQVPDQRKEQARTMIGQCYTRLGSVGLTIDEKSPIAPLLQAAMYLRLGDERLAQETWLAHRALFDQNLNEVPVDLLLFASDNLMAAGGEENHDKVEEYLRGWLVRNSEQQAIDDNTKAQVQFLLAKNFFAARRYDVARSEYTTVINRYAATPYAIEAEFGIGETFMAQKVYDQAEAVFEKLAASRDAEVIVRAEFLRGVLAHRRGDNDQAREIFRTVLERVPSVELANQALFNLAEVYGAEERYMDQLQLLMTVGRLGRVSKRQHAPGSPLSIVVQDSDLGISRGHNRIPVLVRTEPGGDEELVYLTSGGAGKGLFRTDVETRLGQVTKGDKVLQLSGNDVIRCDYPEEFKAEFKSVPLSDVEIRIASDAQFEIASSRIIDEEEETFSQRLEREAREEENSDERQSLVRPKNQIKPGNPVYLRVKDGDRDLTPGKDKIVARLVADSGDQVQITLEETDAHSGVFEGMAETGELPAGALATDTAIDHSPLMAIDHDPKTFWLSEPDGAAPKSLTVDMKDLKTISRAVFHMPEAGRNVPVRADLQASYDGEFWYRVGSWPAVPEAQPVADQLGAMQYRVFSGNFANYTEWRQVVNLVRSGQPMAQGDVRDGQLTWSRPENDENAPRTFAVVWFGKLVQERAGAVRLRADGQASAIAVDGKLELGFGPGNRTVDVWLERGLHDLTIFSAGNQNTPRLSAMRVRSDLNRQNTQLSPFLTSDFDLVSAAELASVKAETPAASGDVIKVDLEKVQLQKKTEQFGLQDQNGQKVLSYWQTLEDSAKWEFDAMPGVYDVWMNWSHQGGGSKLAVEVAGHTLRATVPNSGNWTTSRLDSIGTIAVREAGKVTLSIKAQEIVNGGLMNLRGIELRPASGHRVIVADQSWEFRFAPVEARYTRFVMHEYLGQAVAVNHVEVSGADLAKPFIPTEADVLSLAQNSVLEIAGGDVVTGNYTDDVTQVNAGSSRLLNGTLTATYFNGQVSPIRYDFVRYNNGAVGTIRKQLKRIDAGERIVIEIVDYDRDATLRRDSIKFDVSINGGEPLRLTATETEENSGIFTKEIDTVAPITAAPKTATGKPAAGGSAPAGSATAVSGTETAKSDAEKLTVKPGDKLFLRYLDEQNTFPGHSVPREAVVYVPKPTDARVRVLESRVIPAPANSTSPPQYAYQLPPERAETTNVAFEAPFTIEVIDPDAARDSRSEVIVQLTTTDGAKADVRCVISGAFTAVPRDDEITWALEEGRFIGQIVMQLGGKNSQEIVPISAGMPRNLIGGGKLSDEESGQMDDGLVTRVLNLTGKDRVLVSYRDEQRSTGSASAVTGAGRLISNGVLASVDRDYEKPVERLHVGEKLFLKVIDPDQDSSDERDTVQVQVTSELGEKESVPLVETLAHSGVFTGSLTMKSNEKPQPGNLNVNEPLIETYFGDTLTVAYVDPLASTPEGRLEQIRTLPVVIGTDGLVSAFSKTFQNEKLAVETRFHIAESYFELFKSHKNLGRKEEEKSDLDAGRRMLREIIEDYPDPKYQPRILYLLGQFAQELGDADEAVSSYQQIVQQFPEHPLAADAQYKLAQTYEAAGNFDEALEAYVTLAATYPKSPLIASVMIRIGDHFYKGEEFLIAAEVGKRFIEKFEGHQFASRMAFRIGQCYYKAKEYRRAGDAFDQFAKKFPDDELCSDSLFWAGEAFRMANDTREAFRRYNRCRWDFPASESAKYARGRLALPEMLQQFEAEANAVENETP